MPPKKTNEEFIIEAKSFFEAYKKDIGDSIRKGKKVVYVNFEDLASSSPVLSEALMSNPEDVLQILETALEETGLIKNPRIRFNTLPETQKVKIRTIRAEHLNQLIYFEGLVRQASEVRPQVVNAKFECPTCGTVISVLQIDKKFREPSRCSCGRKGQFRLLSKTMVDAQRLVIEEAPESLVGGEQPRRLSVFLKEDLVEPGMEEKTTPGSKVRALGILKEVSVPLPSGAISTRFDLALEANNLIPLESTYEDFDISEEDERQIQELAADPNLFEKLRGSIAPSIWGYEEIKESLILQMFGGVRKVSPDGTTSRGDIHLFLMGDPGVAKSLGKNEKILYFKNQEYGYTSIENLFKKFGRFPKNLTTLTLDMKTHKHTWKKIKEIIKHIPEKDLIKITTEHGKQITGTKNHSFLTLSNTGEIISIKGDELNENSYIPIPINFHKEIIKDLETEKFNIYGRNSKQLPKKIKLDEGFGFLVGIFLSEGNIRSGRSVNISNKNNKIKDKVRKYVEQLGIKADKENSKGISISSKSLSNLLDFNCYNQELKKEIKTKVKGTYSRIKKIPDFAYFAPKKFIKGMISGIFSGDGRFIKDKKRIKGFELITLSKELAQGTSDILFSLGILNKIKERNYTYKNKKTKYYTLSVNSQMIKKFRKYFNFYGRTYTNYPKPTHSYYNCIPCGDLIYNLTKKLGYNKKIDGNRTFAAEMRTIRKRNKIGRLRLRRILKRFQKRSNENLKEFKILKKIAYSPIIWSKIKNIEHIKKQNQEVYDLSIPSTNTFVANGIGVHNSVTLKFISNIAPKGRYVVGMGASGRGITATVVRDEFLKGWSLEAGAMVLANKGVICIDEIEKMTPEDRSAMHEALEQQTVTISKANVQATLSAQTSVLAAGNPKYGRFEPLQSITQQIDLPPALINRFDLIFILRDLPDKEKDDAIATHVLNLHQMKGEKSQIERDLFRKYIAYAKQKVEPKLTNKAVEEIKNFYVKLRNMQSSGDSKSIPISARQLQGLIRLAEAHAKLRLSSKVDKKDAQVAIRLTNYYLMQVGYDPETKTFDIDRFSIGTSSSQRNKLLLIKETIKKLEEKHGKMVPLDVLKEELGKNISNENFEEAFEKLKEIGDIFQPKSGFVQLI